MKYICGVCEKSVMVISFILVPVKMSKKVVFKMEKVLLCQNCGYAYDYEEVKKETANSQNKEFTLLPETY